MRSSPRMRVPPMYALYFAGWLILAQFFLFLALNITHSQTHTRSYICANKIQTVFIYFHICISKPVKSHAHHLMTVCSVFFVCVHRLPFCVLPVNLFLWGFFSAWFTKRNFICSVFACDSDEHIEILCLYIWYVICFMNGYRDDILKQPLNQV